MAMLLTRDWRTRVLGEVGDLAGARRFFQNAGPTPVDLMILDTEIPGEDGRPGRDAHFTAIARLAAARPEPPRLLYTATVAGGRLLQECLGDGLAAHFGGCILKEEALYGLATAAVLAMEPRSVVTPGVLAAGEGLAEIERARLLDGSASLDEFSPREQEIVRLGLLFNLTKRDISDELVIGWDWVSEAIGKAYEKLGLHEVLDGEIPIEAIFDDAIVQERCRSILGRSGAKPGQGTRAQKAPWMDTLAFHLLTRPEVEG
jgi:DNA-binding NarL/FixJ family response regulator